MEITKLMHRVVRPRGIVRPTMADVINFGLSAHFKHTVRCFDERGRLVWEERVKNLVTRTGVTYLLNVGFKSGAAAGTWYVGLYKGATAPTLATTDTMAAHGFTEIVLSTDCSQAARQVWTPGAISTGADLTTVDNSGVVAVYNMLTTITLQGLFMVDASTGNGTAGLYGEANFSTGQAVQNGYTVNVTSQLQITAG